MGDEKNFNLRDISFRQGREGESDETKVRPSTYLALVNVLMLVFTVEFRLAEVALIFPMRRQAAADPRHSQKPRHPRHSVGTLEKSQDTAILDISQMRSENRNDRRLSLLLYVAYNGQSQFRITCKRKNEKLFLKSQLYLKLNLN